MISNVLATAINAVLPIVLMTALGYILHHKGMLSDRFLQQGNTLVFRLGLPVMLFVNVYNIDSIFDIRWDIALYSMAALLVVFLLGYVVALISTPVLKRRGVVLQCIFYSNFAIIGLTLASTLGGAEAEASMSVLSAVNIPLINILAVLSLSIWRENGKISSAQILKGIIHNPLIQGVFWGMVALALRLAQERIFGEVVFALNRHLQPVYTVLNWIKAMTTPLALLVLGGQFTFSAVKGLRKEIVICSICRLLLAPLVAIGGAYLLDRWGIITCGASDYPALVALFASPVAVSCAIMAAEMDNDEQLANQLGVWTTVFSSVTLFGISCLLMACGLMGA